MKVLLLSGAVKNYGDYLIAKGSYNLLRSLGCNVTEHNRSIELPLDLARQYPIIFFSGGPFLKEHSFFHNRCLADLPHLLNRLCFIGGGWKAPFGDNFDIQNYRYSDKTKKVMVQLRFPIGTRDYMSLASLHQNEIYNCYYSGCPSLFAYQDWSAKPTLKGYVSGKCRLIFTAPQNDILLDQAYKILSILKSDHEITIAFNKGFETPRQTSFAKQIFRDESIPSVDTSGPTRFYDLLRNAHFHIGYRVHSHVASLSAGFPSLLIAEDARGQGLSRSHGVNIQYAFERTKSTEHRLTDAEILAEALTYEYAKELFVLYSTGMLISSRATHSAYKAIVSSL